MEKSRITHNTLKARNLGRLPASFLFVLGGNVPIHDLGQIPNEPESANQLSVKTEQTMAAELSISAIEKQAKLIPRAGNYGNNNWSGYVVDARPGQRFNEVSTELRVPKIDCPAYPYDGKMHGVSIWTGFDGSPPGISNRTVEQSGVDEFCYGYDKATKHQEPYYYLWYETYPGKPVLIRTLPITAGNTITTEVNYSAGDYTYSFDNLSTNKPYSSKPQPCLGEDGCDRSTAEWIVENDFNVLGNFGTTVFRDDKASTTNRLISLGTYLGSNSYGFYTPFNTGAPMAIPSPIQPGGEVFSVRWQNS